MFIQSFRVQNYKSYFDSGVIALSEGFNVIVGQNNVGKSALVEALSLSAGPNPHRSLRTLPTRQTQLASEGQIALTLRLTPEESKAVLTEIRAPFFVPHHEAEHPDQALARLRASMDEGFFLECTHSTVSGRWITTTFLGQALHARKSWPFVQTRLTGNWSAPFVSEGQTTTNFDASLPHQIADVLKARLYAFKAERLNVAESPQGTASVLEPNARNLAQVLNLLQTSNPKRWDRLLEYVRSIFPDITEITVPATATGNVRILVWSIPADTERDDLAISLADSGTGIGQVLAMLYVVLTADSAQPIIIDEPQSFLHPGAIRKLFDILRLHKHQFIVITHSPVVVDAAMPPRLVIVRHVEAESTLDQLTTADADDLRVFLTAVGARQSDVFGADRVLWVEGKTEEAALPLILAAHPKVDRGATAILGVRHTSKFNTDARSVMEIYRKLSRGPRLMPTTVGFYLDRETLKPSEIADLVRQGQGMLAFTRRRMFENYLLVPAAITSVMNSIDGFATTSIDEKDVERWIETHMWDPTFYERVLPTAERNFEVWRRDVNAGRLLRHVFTDFSNTRVQYDKPRHGLALTSWLCTNAPGEFADIVSDLAALLESDAKRDVRTVR